MAANTFKGTGKKTDIQTVRIPFMGNPNVRANINEDKDAKFLNGFFDPVKNPITGDIKYQWVKRPGLLGYIRPPAANATGRGIISWKGDVYSVFGTQIYKNTTNLGITLTTSVGLCGMTFTRPGAAVQYLGINDGVNLYLIDTVGGVTSSISNFPTPNTRDLVYKDGYWFTLKADNTLWNCNLDDPTVWDPTKWITAQMQNSSGVGIATQTNVMFVFGNDSMQAFFDNGNTTGSPMSNMESAMQQIGLAVHDSLVSDEAQVTWVSRSNTGAFSVYTLDGVTGIKEIGTPTINRYIRRAGVSGCHANMMRFGGHRFYVLYIPLFGGACFLYDYETNLWVEWDSAAGGTGFPFADSYQHDAISSLLIQDISNGWIYTTNTTLFTDDGVDFTVLVRFGPLDLDTYSRKFCRRAEIIGDKQSSTCNVLLQYSDDDYTTLSTAKILDMSQARPFATRLGNFRDRAWQVSYTGDGPFRAEALELKIRLGDD